MVEEDVDELPEQVVEGLDELLSMRHGRRCRGRSSHSRVRPVLEGDRHRAGALARQDTPRNPRSASSIAEARSTMSSGSAMSSTCARSGAALGGQGDRRQRPLADDHRDGRTRRPRGGRRSGPGGRPERDQPPAAGEALRHPVAAARERLRVRLEEGGVRLCAGGAKLVDAAREYLGAGRAHLRRRRGRGPGPPPATRRQSRHPHPSWYSRGVAPRRDSRCRGWRRTGRGRSRGGGGGRAC